MVIEGRRAMGPRPFSCNQRAGTARTGRRLTVMRLAQEAEVESLLKREFRSRLPLVQQVRLYLDPFALFKRATRGRERALSYNRELRWVLLSYLRRWLLIAASLFVGIAPAEAIATETTIVPAAAIAVGFCMAMSVLTCIVAAYLLLGAKRQ